MHAFRAAVGILVFSCATGWAQKEEIPDNRWELIKQKKATSDAHAGPFTVMLLRSSEPTDTGGAEQALHDVQLLVLQGDKVIYDFVKEGVTTSEERKSRFYMDDYLEIRDVTRDGIPEILFHSGSQGASDYGSVEHILAYQKAKGSFADITAAQFYDSSTHGLRWLNSVFLVIADRNWNATTTPFEEQCHYCDSPFQYDVYQWSRRKMSFVLHRHLYGQKSYSDASQALAGDWSFIQSKMNR